ncbi:hypothetical protein DAEQUDRAFT_741263 [Daedalea quercina L-15889]|uniref:BHLH domain-containing protein n=1 Tax=Daedalea quercina L-15889 TaxID=1314783 RepID=A0A165LHX4_9APHY|nr:hypothetical protein DAEQUDRAFT_741263 [Daedalea quercina L-15889]
MTGTIAPYTASCNPPRRAKRPRTDAAEPAPSAAHDAGSSRTPARRARPAILPKSTVPGLNSPQHDAPESDSGDEDDYEPDARTTTQRRRGRKPGAMSRSARESLRKLNHSRIEKARRTKINETLSTLSTLVNEAEQEKLREAGGTPTETKAKGKAEEKEFKLDVLVKTVSYLQELIDKVRTLEAAAEACPHCSRDRVAGSAPTLKRKRLVEEQSDHDVEMDGSIDDHDDDVEYAGDDEKGDAEPEHDASTLPDHSPALAAAAAPASASTRPTPSPRLPPIAAWLPHPYVDPSCIAAMSDSRAVATSQLPSPPLSGPFRAASVVAARDVPALTLPAPAHPLESDKGAGRPAGEKSAAREERRRGTQSRSPTWTPEDETAASLLLQMSSSPTSMRSGSAPSSSSSTVGISAFALPPARRLSLTRMPGEGDPKKGAGVRIQAETPSSLLGLGR